MATNKWIGNFAGRTLVQQSGAVGGSRNVFVKLQGLHNELVFPTFGARIMNPFKGAAKLYAGDLAWYKTDDDGLNPEYYILKTFEVVSASGKNVFIVRDGYHHIPFVGDKLTVAPDEVGGTGAKLVVVGVTAEVKDGADVWKLELSSAPTSAPTSGDVLVECDDAGKMLVKEINSVCPCDYDFRYPAGDLADGGAQYLVSFALGGLMYTNKMSPMPDCVKALNTSKVNGWFKVGSWGNF